jgi:hypothetical protein
MCASSDRRRNLENAFSILRFRTRGVVSFRRFIVLSLWSGQNAIDLHQAVGDTQPMRALRG